MEQVALPEQLETEIEEQEESEITPEMIAQRETAIKRTFWVLVVLCIIVSAFVIWEIVDLMGS